MVRRELRAASAIERRPYVPEQHQTQDRDEVADWISDHAASNYASWSHEEIGEETGFSRQHVDNVVEHYFKPAGDASGVEALAEELELGDASGLQAALGSDVTRELLIYRLGYRDGQRDALDAVDDTDG